MPQIMTAEDVRFVRDVEVMIGGVAARMTSTKHEDGAIQIAITLPPTMRLVTLPPDTALGELPPGGRSESTFAFGTTLDDVEELHAQLKYKKSLADLRAEQEAQKVS